MCGEVVGVNTLLFSRTGSFSGVGFSVPSTLAKRSVDQIIEKGYVTYPAIGIQMKAVETLEERKELLSLGINSVIKIENTPEEGAAYEAGLKKDDVIVAVGGEEVISSLDIVKQLWYNDIGDVLKVKVYRDGEFMTFDVKLKEFQFMNVKGK
jgi:S1-C subfamily serine protease